MPRSHRASSRVHNRYARCAADPPKLKDEEQKIDEHLRQGSPEVSRTQELAGRFVGIIRERNVNELRG